MTKIPLIFLFCLLGWVGLLMVPVPGYGSASRPASSVEPPPSEYHRVVVYTLSGCSHCQAAKRYLIDKKVPFDTREIDGNPANLAEFMKIYDELGVVKPARVVPLIIIGGRIRLQGFEKDKLQKALRETAR